MDYIAGLSAATNATSAAPGAGAKPEEQVTKDLFLKLMVAQLRNQNPLNPVDGVDFLMQLSQISGVEQLVDMNQTLSSIESILKPTEANNS